jgi:hypothetical protein
MTKSILCCVSILALVAAAAPGRAGEPAVEHKQGSPGAASQKKSGKVDCEARIQDLNESQADGEERLTEKNAVIDTCASQYKTDKMIGRLVKECAKYEKQPVVQQQFVAECQLAAFNYANALSTVKAEYGK